MEIITLTNNANFARVKLGEIRPNRFRDLDRWPVERSVIDGLKQSINETGFWNNLQAIHNERGEVELRFGHHRWTAGLELFGPDYEVAVEMVPFQGEWSLLRALHMENAINRNKVTHTHEVVSQLTHWWDDVVFENFPSWEEIKTGYLARLKVDDSYLRVFFGDEGDEGGRNYAKCVKYGIGRRVIAKMLEGTESETSIRQALESLPLTDRRKRGLELQAEEQRALAEQHRQEAARLEKELEAARITDLVEADRHQKELDAAHKEQLQAELAVKKAKDEEAKRFAEEKKQEAIARKEQVEADRAVQAEKRKALMEKQRVEAAQAAKNAAKAEDKAAENEKTIAAREWFDPRAAEVFDRPAHGSAFRIAVSESAIKPHLQTQDLLPFAKAIRASLGETEITADAIRHMVIANFRTFRLGIRQQEALIEKGIDKEHPVYRIQRRIESALHSMTAANTDIGGLLSEINTQHIVGTDLGLLGDKFDRIFTTLDATMAEFKRLRQPK